MCQITNNFSLENCEENLHIKEEKQVNIQNYISKKVRPTIRLFFDFNHSKTAFSFRISSLKIEKSTF